MGDKIITKLKECLRVKSHSFKLIDTGSKKVYLTRDDIISIISDLEKEKDIDKRISENTSHMYDFMTDKW